MSSGDTHSELVGHFGRMGIDLTVLMGIGTNAKCHEVTLMAKLLPIVVYMTFQQYAKPIPLIPIPRFVKRETNNL